MKEIRESEERWARDNSWDSVIEKSERRESALGSRIQDEVLESIEKDALGKMIPEDVGEEVVSGMENLGPLGTDSDGLGEQVIQADYTTKRRKSLDAAMNADSPPSSPLKECSFGFEDPATGCQVWSGARLCSCSGKEDDKYSADEDGDIQMKEVAMAKSLLLRFGKKDVTDETFGDEDMGEI